MTESDPKEKKIKECYPHDHYHLPQLLQKPKHGEGGKKKVILPFFFLIARLLLLVFTFRLRARCWYIFLVLLGSGVWGLKDTGGIAGWGVERSFV